MGAYTKAAGSSFNGFNTADIATRYVYSPPEGKVWMDEMAESSGSDYGKMIIGDVGSSSISEEDEEEEVEECAHL